MSKIYARMLIKGSKDLKDVPDIWQGATIIALEGFVQDGTTSQERVDEILTKGAEDGVIAA